MATKKKAGAEKIAGKLAALALRHLSSFSAEEQERASLRPKNGWLMPLALVGLEHLHRLLVLGRTGFLPEVDENLLKESLISLPYCV